MKTPRIILRRLKRLLSLYVIFRIPWHSSVFRRNRNLEAEVLLNPNCAGGLLPAEVAEPQTAGRLPQLSSNLRLCILALIGLGIECGEQSREVGII